MYKRKVVQLLSKYIRGLTPDQVSSHLLSGEFELRSAELDVTKLNSLLAGHLPYTLEVRVAECDFVRVQVPWSALRSRPVRVRVGACRAEVEVHSRNDTAWATAAAERLREVTVETAASRTVREGESCPTVKLTDMKVAVADGLEIIVASVEVVLLSAVAAHHHGPCGPSVAPAWKLVVTDMCFGPSNADGSRAEGRPGVARERGKQWTALRRRLTLGTVAIHAIGGAPHDAVPEGAAARQDNEAGAGTALDSSTANAGYPSLPASPPKPVQACTKSPGAVGGPALSIAGIVMDLLEWRDAGLVDGADAGADGSKHADGAQAPGGAKKSRRVARFPRELRTRLQVPRVDIHCNEYQLAALAALASDVAVPSVPPLEALPPEVRHLHWRDPSIAEAVARRAKAREAAAASPAKLRMSSLFKMAKMQSPPRTAGPVPAADCIGPDPDRSSQAQPDTESAEQNENSRGDSKTSTITGRASELAQRGATSALKTASAAGSIAQHSASAVATGAAKTAGTAGSLAQKGATVAATGASIAATGAAAAATAAMGRAAAGARMAERTAVAAASVASRPSTMMTSATKTASAARQAATDKAKGAASSFFRGSKMFQAPRQLVGSAAKPTTLIENDAEATSGSQTVADVEQQVIAMGFDEGTVARVQMQTGASTVDELVSAICVELNAAARQEAVAATPNAEPEALVDQSQDWIRKSVDQDVGNEAENRKENVMPSDSHVAADEHSTTCTDFAEGDANLLAGDTGDAASLAVSDARSICEDGGQPEEADEDDDAEEELDSEEDDDEQLGSVTAQHADKVVSGTNGAGEAAARAHAMSAAQTMWAGPPPFLRRLALHVSVGTILVEVSVHGTKERQSSNGRDGEGETQQTVQKLVLDVDALDITVEEMRCLTDAEVKSLQGLLGVTAPANLSGGGHGCVTLGTARLRLVGNAPVDNCVSAQNIDSLFWTEAAAAGGAGGAPPWLFTARWGRVLKPSTQECDKFNSDAGLVRATVCLHGARAVAEPKAVTAVESVVAAIAESLPSHDGGPGFETPPLPMIELNVACRNTSLDVGLCAPLQPLRAIIPGVFLTAAALQPGDSPSCATAARSEGGDSFGDVHRLPSVPPWHASAAATAGAGVEPDFHVYGCICDDSAGSPLSHQCPNGSTDDAQYRVTEQQWRVARHADALATLEVLVPADEFVTLSNAKLQAVEHAAEWEAMAQSWHERSTRAVSQDTVRRIAMVRELVQDGGLIGLQGLEMEARELEEERQEDQLRLRTCEREAGIAVASVYASHAAREEELCRQLGEEREITEALSKLVEQQEAAIRELERKAGAS